ncbi:MAG: acyl carrier protein [Phycisphaerales bacterium]
MPAMKQDEIFSKVREVLVDALAADEDEVTPQATLVSDLGAESIDMLDITFKLEQAFGFKIAQGELIPESLLRDPRYVRDGRVTGEGLAALRARLPYVDFTALEADPQVSKVMGVFTVETLVKFVEQKLAK